MELETNVHGIIVPHVPTLLEYELDYKPSPVITELRETGKRMKEWGVEAVVVADTHWQTGDKSKYKQFLVQQAILKLPETQRVILVLHDLEEVSSPEIARILNINANAVKSRLHRGRAALRNIISRGFEVKGMEGVGVLSVGPSGKLM